MSSPVPFSLANKKLVSSLYRQSLRTAQNWINRKDFYRKKAAEIRGRFEANKHIEDPNQLKSFIRLCSTKLRLY
ncbi:unnamed protein product [Kuraishia capsulata CBS 1993]|uniref:NADH dehydrogenase [ubiquinone] 1 beta subcomplex subunit 9 n=1 Tax=Kuraishia capsulata CBS 1993 TaxID=1382522 RepID=W6MN77_9ASCO|nr:uncharacterized protein KUCA_T00004075001 [Kuraishia capsulata CBS 1993]CDK28094.1 unnamed protein product [Kuraishia capsulata CBS 1993]